MVACAVDELQTGVGQSAREPAGGIDGNQGVQWVSEQEHRRMD
jgi:hypothetical protein